MGCPSCGGQRAGFCLSPVRLWLGFRVGCVVITPAGFLGRLTSLLVRVRLGRCPCLTPRSTGRASAWLRRASFHSCPASPLWRTPVNSNVRHGPNFFSHASWAFGGGASGLLSRLGLCVEPKSALNEHRCAAPVCSRPSAWAARPAAVSEPAFAFRPFGCGWVFGLGAWLSPPRVSWAGSLRCWFGCGLGGVHA